MPRINLVEVVYEIRQNRLIDGQVLFPKNNLAILAIAAVFQIDQPRIDGGQG